MFFIFYGRLQDMNAKQSMILVTMEREQNLMSGVSDDIQRKFLKDILVLEERLSEVAHDCTTVERRKAEAEELRVSDTFKGVLGERTVSGLKDLKLKMGLGLRAVPGRWNRKS